MLDLSRLSSANVTMPANSFRLADNRALMQTFGPGDFDDLAKMNSRPRTQVYAPSNFRLISSLIAKMLIPSLASYVPDWPFSFRILAPPA